MFNFSTKQDIWRINYKDSKQESITFNRDDQRRIHGEGESAIDIKKKKPKKPTAQTTPKQNENKNPSLLKMIITYKESQGSINQIFSRVTKDKSLFILSKVKVENRKAVSLLERY